MATDSPETPGLPLHQAELDHFLTPTHFFTADELRRGFADPTAFSEPADPCPEGERLARRLLDALKRKATLDRDPRAAGTIAAEKAASDVIDLASDAVERGLELRVDLHLGDPFAIRTMQALIELGATEPPHLGVCRGCRRVWRRPVRGNLADYCAACHKVVPAKDKWQEVETASRLLPEAIANVGLNLPRTQECVVCGDLFEVERLRSPAYCGGACRQRAKRRRDRGLQSE